MKETLIFITGPVIAAFATWFFARRKTAAEAASLELSNSAKIITMWRELSTGMELRFREEVAQLRKDNCDLETKVRVVEAENEALLKKMRAMEEENAKLIIQLKIFNQANPQMEKQTLILKNQNESDKQ